LGIAVRIVALGLVVLILYQVLYRDVLVWEGTKLDGSVRVEDGHGRFEVEDSDRVIDLGESWRDNEDLTLGLFTIVRHSKKLLLALLVLIYGPITLISITRWWYLLRKVDIPTPLVEVFRLTFIGFFFNNAVPGLTGGDLVKAFYISRQATGARVRAFMSVLVDRVIGLIALALLAGIVVLPSLGDTELRAAATIVWGFLGVCVVFGVLFLSRRLRKLTRLDRLVAKLPFAHVIKEVARGVLIYRDVPGAVVLGLVLSLMNHLALTFIAVGIGTALGIEIPISRYFILFPVCMMLASIPALPGGWGVRELAFIAFFRPLGVPTTLAVALSIAFGLTQLFWSLLGGVLFLLRADRVSAKDLRTFSDEVEAEVEESPQAELDSDA
ncbi:MAG: lysylphosphatidylglycerol synthase transmembrane domain-containing protein, partial [Planctomycetota bacterium]